MKLADFLARLDHAQIQALEKRLGRHRHYLHRISCGERKPSYTAALTIEEATNGAVRRWDLRPDIWWPPGAPRPKPAPLKANGAKRQRKARASA
jgi:DNA-binding transcriptional regulator YdaS (Cro superfamily)